MFNQNEADEILGISAPTVRTYAEKIGVTQDDGKRGRRYSIGDLVLIRIAVDLVDQGYGPRLATSIAFAIRPEFNRLVVDEGRGTRAWLAFRADGDAPPAMTILRTAADGIDFLEANPDATVLAGHALVRVALEAVLAETTANA